MAAGGIVQTPAKISRSSSRSSPSSTSSARQKKFHRHFTQVRLININKNEDNFITTHKILLSL